MMFLISLKVTPASWRRYGYANSELISTTLALFFLCQHDKILQCVSGFCFIITGHCHICFVCKDACLVAYFGNFCNDSWESLFLLIRSEDSIQEIQCSLSDCRCSTCSYTRPFPADSQANCQNDYTLEDILKMHLALAFDTVKYRLEQLLATLLSHVDIQDGQLGVFFIFDFLDDIIRYSRLGKALPTEHQSKFCFHHGLPQCCLETFPVDDFCAVRKVFRLHWNSG